MKKFLFMLMAVLVIFIGAGCHSDYSDVGKVHKTTVVKQTASVPVVQAVNTQQTPFLLVQDTGTATDTGDSGGSSGGIFSNLGNGVVNIILLVITSIFGGLWLKVRTKVQQVGELFLKAYEYTNDNKLSDDERTDLINRFFSLIGKSAVKRE